MIAGHNPLTATTDTAQAQAFVRAAILDSRKALFGYQLALASPAAPPGFHTQLLLQAVELAGHPMVGGRRKIFVRCLPSLLANEALGLLDPEIHVVDVQAPGDLDPAAVEQTAGLLSAWRLRGLRFAFGHEVLAPSCRSWHAHASYIKLDMARLPRSAVPQLAKASTGLDAQVLACSIDTADAYRTAAELGATLFQGNWFARPVLQPNQQLRPNQATILQLVGLLRREADVGEIESLLKRDASLAFNLLRFVNSGAFGFARQVTSFRSAVMLLGMQRLLRWATVLMAHSCSDTPALGHAAVVRGRLMELLARELLPADQTDQAFVVGVFSLLPAMAGVSMDRALDGLALPEAIEDALLERGGLYEPFLSLAQACESADDAAFTLHCDRLLLSGRQVNMAHLEALVWAEDMLAG